MLGTYYGYDAIGPVAELLSRQLGFSDTQIGSLNAIYSLPNIFMALIGGVQIDRFGARRVLFWTSLACLIGAILTASTGFLPIMMLGRLIFGLGSETLMVSVLVALGRWFSGRYLALFLALNLSVARLGSYLADRSPSFARPLYERGWQFPLWLAAALAVLAFVCAVVYGHADGRETERGNLADQAREGTATDWRNLLRFPREYWYIVGLCVSFYSVILPFRSTFAIKYFQQSRALSLETASQMNSYVFMAAIFAMPVLGFLVDRFGRHVPLLILGSILLPLAFLCLGDNQTSLWIPTVLLGISFSLVPAVLWPAVTQYVPPQQRGTAYGVMSMLQNTGLTSANVIVGRLNDSNLAGAVHPEGYAPMLWFFGLMSLAGCVCAVILGFNGAAPTVSNQRPNQSAV